ncbi:MAG: hypothetical protein ABH833_00105 [Parcubacteria group bacterium]
MEDQIPEQNQIPREPEAIAPQESAKSSWLIVLIIAVIAIAGYFIITEFFLNESPDATPSTSPMAGHISNGDITWNAPKKIASLEIYQPTEYGYDRDENAKYYSVGTIDKGEYEGATLILVLSYPEGPGGEGLHRILEKNGKIIFLVNHSDEVNFDNEYGTQFDTAKLTIDEDTVIDPLVYPETLNGPEADQKLEKAKTMFPRSVEFFSSQDKELVFTHQTYGNVYKDVEGTNGKGGFYLKSPDGLLLTYVVEVSFQGEDHVPDIQWFSGGQNDTAYQYTDFGGCGSTNFASVQDINLLEELMPAGRTSNEESIYIFQNSNNPRLLEFYEEGYFVINEEDKIPYDEFVQTKPLVYWVDPFGRLIEFKNTDYAPLAECGKPVIYLYPKTTIEVSVQVSPVGGFTYTEPAYQNGWKVIAEPNGQLTEVSTGINYPYLFWEGRGGLYETPERGFVISQSEVHDFLVKKLTLFGLNKTEIADFIEYWEPFMQDSPYYFVTFMGNKTMDQIAPLNIDPMPDTVIRVLMDFEPLEKPIKIEGYNIQTPERKGFTVIEWGGVRK